MCRIVGLIDFSESRVDPSILANMRDSLAAGGPDFGDSYVDNNVGIAHRRLSILDLSTSGAQPMVLKDWIISYNGEIYNFHEIKEELISLNYTFKTKTDTEVILISIVHWGMKAISKFRGMFSFALFNIDTRKLILCRDRLGVKPLYWYLKDKLLMFSSELKAFHQHPAFDREINLKVIPGYLKKGYIAGDVSIYKYVNKVSPGTYLEINKEKNITKHVYWSIDEVYANATLDERSDGEIIDFTESKLIDSFKLRMVSDVDVGVFLSGGTDSALITALLQHTSSEQLRTFTIGFDQTDLDESPLAKRIAEHLGTNHESLICTADVVKNVIPILPQIYDEPFGDSSGIPTYLVSKLASKNVKVALSGDGGDELFSGYSKYSYLQRAKILLQVPIFVRKHLNSLLNYVNSKDVKNLLNTLGYNYQDTFENKYDKLKLTLLAIDIEDMYEKASSYISDINLTRLSNGTLENSLNMRSLNDKKNLLNYFSYQDMKSYLPGDILTKVDRASMSVGLESREPFLDHNLVEYAFSIPERLKISPSGEKKFIAKKILSKYLPDHLINTPKRGFSVPIDHWLNGFLKEEVIDLKNEEIFFQKYNLKSNFYKEIVQSYYNRKSICNPYVIWFIYCLYKWDKAWG